MRSTDLSERPSIEIHTNRKVTADDLRHILLGMEEEGIPYRISQQDELNPLVLAHDAAVSSRLGVGVGIALDFAVITLEKLTQQRPYLATHWQRSCMHDRLIGSNAGRLVKRLPLRPLTEGNTTWKH